MKTREEMQAAHDAFWATIEGTVPNPGIWIPRHIELSRYNANTLCWCLDCKNPRHAELLAAFDACARETVANVADLLARRAARQ